MPTDDTAERTPYCVAKGCADLPPRKHLEEHAHWGCTGPDQMAELIDAFEQHVRAQVAEPVVARWTEGVVHHDAGTTVQCVDVDDPLRDIALELTVDGREALGLMLLDPDGEMDQPSECCGEERGTLAFLCRTCGEPQDDADAVSHPCTACDAPAGRECGSECQPGAGQ